MTNPIFTLNIGKHSFAIQQESPVKNRVEQTIDLGDEESNHNLWMLFQRNVGTHFRVTDSQKEGGEKKKVFEEITFKHRFDYFRGKLKKDDDRKNVKDLVLETLNKLNDVILEKTKDNPSDVKIYRFILKQFFGPKGPLGTLSPSLLDRNELKSTLSTYILPDHSIKVQFGKNEKDPLILLSKTLFEQIPSFNPVKFCLGKKRHNENLSKLLRRQKGEHFKVEKGKLVSLSKKEKILYRLRPSLRNKNREAVQKVVSKTLKKLEEFLNKRIVKDKHRSLYRFILADAFDEKGVIGRLSKALFEHSKIITEGSAFDWFTLPVGALRLQLGDGKTHVIRSENYRDLSLRETKPIDLDTGDKTVSHNLKMWLERKQKTYFKVNNPLENSSSDLESGVNSQTVEGENKKPLLETLNWKERLKFRFSKDYRKAIRPAVQSTLKSIIEKLNEKLESVQKEAFYNVAAEHYKTVYSTVMEELFCDEKHPLASLKPSFFDRGLIKAGCALERALMPELEKSRKNLIDKLIAFRDEKEIPDPQEQNKKDVEEAFLQLAFQEMTFAHAIGIDMKSISEGGSGGARFAKDRHQHNIFVVKPGDEGPYGVNNPQWSGAFKRRFIPPKKCLNGVLEPLAEEDSYILDRMMNLFVVPPTDFRFVKSRQFYGEDHKECSIQAFVKDAQTLSAYLKIPNWMQDVMPRAFLRWYLGGSEKKGDSAADHFFEWLRDKLGGKEKENLMKSKMPEEKWLELLERIGVHNFLIEDIDCHLDNILVKEEKENTDSIAHKIFSKKQGLPNPTDEEIKVFVDELYVKNGYQELLSEFLHYVTVDEKINSQEGKQEKQEENQVEKKRIYLVKHDGGASSVVSHPTGMLETRNKHLFEVLPQFLKPFSEEMKNCFQANEQITAFYKTLAEKALKVFDQTVKEEVATFVDSTNIITTIEKFWNENGNLFRNLCYSEEKQTENSTNVDQIINELLDKMTFTGNIAQDVNQRKFQMKKALTRIRGMVQTRLESWRVLQDHLSKQSVSKPLSMRELFRIRTEKEFKTALKDHVPISVPPFNFKTPQKTPSQHGFKMVLTK